jgi:site-specific DNA-methyltransferase (adenine-specific)
MDYKLYNGDCLVEMDNIEDHSVDLVLCGLPYGITGYKWDVIIPFEPLWEQYERILKEDGVILLFGAEPFASQLRLSNLEMYKYDLYWLKDSPRSNENLDKKPSSSVETISVYSHGPWGDFPEYRRSWETEMSQIHFPRARKGEYKHPTPMPVGLANILIRAYSKPGDVVLDNTMGCGSCGVACAECGRNFIGIERDETYFKIEEKDIKKAYGKR